MSDGRAEVQAALPAYEVGLELGRGAWGVVFGARHRHLQREVAVKQLPRSFASDPKVRERFLHEARMVASLEHPHIVPVYDFVESDTGLCLIVMERCDGTLADRFRASGLATDEACAAGLATCSALAYAHRRHVLHRDIKPENLLYDHEENLKLADFGIARALDVATRLTATGTVMGTPAYMSPEQAGGEELTPVSDIYSTGVMLYELLSGELPFASVDSIAALIRQHLFDPPRPLATVAPAVPGPIAEVVETALAKHPGDRFADATAFGVALAEAAAHAFGPGWVRERRFPLHGSAEILAATERSVGGAGRAGTVVVRGQPRPEAAPAPPATEAVASPPTPAPAVSAGFPSGPPLTPSPPAGAPPATPGAGPTARSGGRGLAIGVAVGAVALVAGALLFLSGGGDDGGTGDAPGAVVAPQPAGPTLTLGAVYSGDGDDQVAIDLARQEVDDAGGVLGGDMDLIDGTGLGEVADQVDQGATVIVTSGSASEGAALIDVVGGRAVTISATDFFVREEGAAERYFRTRPTFPLLAYAVPGEVADADTVVVVDGTSAPAASGATASTLVELLEADGHTVDLLPADSPPGAVRRRVSDSGAGAVVFVGVPDLFPYYEVLLDAGVNPSTTRFVEVGGDGHVDGFPDGALTGAVGILFDVLVGDALEERVPASDLSADAAQAYDAVIVAALATEAAGSADPDGIAEQLPLVTSGEETCATYAACLDLLTADASIDYTGASGPLGLDPVTGERRAATVARHVQGAASSDSTRESAVVRAT